MSRSSSSSGGSSSINRSCSRALFLRTCSSSSSISLSNFSCFTISPIKSRDLFSRAFLDSFILSHSILSSPSFAVRSCNDSSLFIRSIFFTLSSISSFIFLLSDPLKILRSSAFSSFSASRTDVIAFAWIFRELSDFPSELESLILGSHFIFSSVFHFFSPGSMYLQLETIRCGFLAWSAVKSQHLAEPIVFDSAQVLSFVWK
mmetsp:Transcript_21779/g.53331  ORF Transcript_21779/g.53331 Transcript_21779/m.53331 type:complete len:203 (+) Transcript_21779:850-1458(+)